MTVQVDVVEAVTPAFVLDELWPLYREVFGDFDDHEAWHEQVWHRHSSRAGFRLALARAGAELVGFGYGYTGEHGQWWTDTASTVWAVIGPGFSADRVIMGCSWPTS